MKATVLSESAADEAAYAVLVSAILAGQTLEWCKGIQEGGGWSEALDATPSTIRHAHYRTDIELVVIVLDSDTMPEVDPTTAARWRHARLDQLRARASQTLSSLSPVGGRNLPHVAVGLAVPALEAWLLCGRHHFASEAAFVQGHWPQRDSDLRRRLKREVYGTDAPTLEEETRIATAQAQRLAADLQLLRDNFPFGFSALEDDLLNRR